MKTKLITGFGGLLSVYILLGLLALSGFKILSRFTVVLYEHPLAVSNAALHEDSLISKIHRDMKDPVLLSPRTPFGVVAGQIEEQEKVLAKDGIGRLANHTRWTKKPWPEPFEKSSTAIRAHNHCSRESAAGPT